MPRPHPSFASLEASRNRFGCDFCGFHLFFHLLVLFLYYRGGTTKATSKPLSRHAGEITYHGPAAKIAAHFESLGFPCPSNFNPADHVMFLLQKDPAVEAPGPAGSYSEAVGPVWWPLFFGEFGRKWIGSTGLVGFVRLFGHTVEGCEIHFAPPNWNDDSLELPTNNGFPWLPSGAGFRPLHSRCPFEVSLVKNRWHWLRWG